MKMMNFATIIMKDLEASMPESQGMDRIRTAFNQLQDSYNMDKRLREVEEDMKKRFGISDEVSDGFDSIIKKIIGCGFSVDKDKLGGHILSLAKEIRERDPDNTDIADAAEKLVNDHKTTDKADAEPKEESADEPKKIPVRLKNLGAFIDESMREGFTCNGDDFISSYNIHIALADGTCTNTTFDICIVDAEESRDNIGGSVMTPDPADIDTSVFIADAKKFSELLHLATNCNDDCELKATAIASLIREFYANHPYIIDLSA
jgi:hypothetical protein